MSHGTLTMQVARVFQKEFIKEGFDILHDHGQKGIDQQTNLGKLRSWFGTSPKLETILSDLDIAVVLHETEKIYALIEIEETTDKPKVILGDILATLLGEGIVFQGKHNLKVGKYTTMIVMVHVDPPSHINRIIYLEKQTNNIRKKLLTPNSSIGRIVVDDFSGKEQLENKLRQHIKNAIVNAPHSE